MKRIASALVITLFYTLIGTASAAEGAVPQWGVQKDKSHLRFAGKEGGHDFSGEFRAFNCKIAFDRKDLSASSVEVSVDTASAWTGNKTYDDSLPGSDWFKVKDFPKARFNSRAIRQLPDAQDGTENYEAAGTLTISGVSRPVVLPFSLKNLVTDGSAVQAQGSLTLKRLDFGLGATLDNKGEAVANEVIVNFDITAQKNTPQ